MNFWIVKCFCKDTNNIDEMFVAADKNHAKAAVKKDLLSVYTQYKKMSLRKGVKPENWTLFEGKI
jgi:hypothetical protein